MNKLAKYAPQRSFFGAPFFRSPFSLAFSDYFDGKEFAGFMPAVNIAEDEKSWHIEVSAPGFTKEDFSVKVDEDVLNISGEHKDEKNDAQKNYSRREFRYGSFRRSFALPAGKVNVEGIHAAYENGILHISVPKHEEEKKESVKEIKIA